MILSTESAVLVADTLSDKLPCTPVASTESATATISAADPEVSIFPKLALSIAKLILPTSSLSSAPLVVLEPLINNSPPLLSSLISLKSKALIGLLVPIPTRGLVPDLEICKTSVSSLVVSPAKNLRALLPVSNLISAEALE